MGWSLPSFKWLKLHRHFGTLRCRFRRGRPSHYDPGIVGHTYFGISGHVPLEYAEVDRSHSCPSKFRRWRGRQSEQAHVIRWRSRNAESGPASSRVICLARTCGFIPTWTAKFCGTSLRRCVADDLATDWDADLARCRHYRHEEVLRWARCRDPTSIVREPFLWLITRWGQRVGLNDSSNARGAGNQHRNAARLLHIPPAHAYCRISGPCSSNPQPSRLHRTREYSSPAPRRQLPD